MKKETLQAELKKKHRNKKETTMVNFMPTNTGQLRANGYALRNTNHRLNKEETENLNRLIASRVVNNQEASPTQKNPRTRRLN